VGQSEYFAELIVNYYDSGMGKSASRPRSPRRGFRSKTFAVFLLGTHIALVASFLPPRADWSRLSHLQAIFTIIMLLVMTIIVAATLVRAFGGRRGE
jgi:hypothetical protein